MKNGKTHALESVNVKEYFGITQDVSFVNAKVRGDVRCFVDPSFLRNLVCENFDSFTSFAKVRSFFLKVLHLYGSGRKDEAITLFTAFSENDALGLGYSLGQRDGKGVSGKMLTDVFDKLLLVTNLSEDELANPAIYNICIQGFGEDRFTDLITTIISSELLDYTVLESVSHNIPLSENTMVLGHYWDGEQFQPLVGKCPVAKGQPIIFAPYKLLTKKYAYTIQRFLGRVVLPAKQADYFHDHGKNISQKELLQAIRKQYSKRGYLKSYAMDQVVENPGYLSQYLGFVDRKGMPSHSIPLESSDDIA